MCHGYEARLPLTVKHVKGVVGQLHFTLTFILCHESKKDYRHVLSSTPVIYFHSRRVNNTMRLVPVFAYTCSKSFVAIGIC